MASSFLSTSTAAGGRLGTDELYAEAMHSILSSEPYRGLVTEPTRLLPHVYIGSQSNAEDLATMRRIGITHVLNCAGYKGPRPSPDASPYEGLGIAYYEFKAEDNDRYDITKHFNEAFRFLDAAKRGGGIVLVHCALGINRSAAVCVAYMIVERRQPLLAATRIIKDRRRIVLANKAFQRQLVRFARARGLLGELPSSEENGEIDDDERLSGTIRRLTLNNSSSYGTSTSSSRYNHVVTSADFSPRHKSSSSAAWLSRSATTRSGESDDVTSFAVTPRQYRASKSATSLLPASTSIRTTSRTLPNVQSRSSSGSRFSVGFL